jgi:hypothetical protein
MDGLTAEQRDVIEATVQRQESLSDWVAARGTSLPHPVCGAAHRTGPLGPRPRLELGLEAISAQGSGGDLVVCSPPGRGRADHAPVSLGAGPGHFVARERGEDDSGADGVGSAAAVTSAVPARSTARIAAAEACTGDSPAVCMTCTTSPSPAAACASACNRLARRPSTVRAVTLVLAHRWPTDSGLAERYSLVTSGHGRRLHWKPSAWVGGEGTAPHPASRWGQGLLLGCQPRLPAPPRHPGGHPGKEEQEAHRRNRGGAAARASTADGTRNATPSNAASASSSRSAPSPPVTTSAKRSTRAPSTSPRSGSRSGTPFLDSRNRT